MHVGELFALNGSKVSCKYCENGKPIKLSVEASRIYPGQRELINKLQDNGIEFFIVTAALEELVRMVVSDPKYGINVKPQNVIGLSTLLKGRQTGDVTTAKLQISKGHFLDDQYSKQKSIISAGN